MHLFHRRPKIPEPNITYTLNTPDNNGLYRPGSTVSGTVTFSCPTRRQVKSITAEFYGHCITHNTRTETQSGPGNNTRTIHYHDDVDLFRYEQDLTPENGEFAALEDEEFNFDFEFTFPEATMEDMREEAYTDDTAGSETYDIEQHSLPPTYEWNYSDRQVAEVEYRIDI